MEMDGDGRKDGWMDWDAECVDRERVVFARRVGWCVFDEFLMREPVTTFERTNWRLELDKREGGVLVGRATPQTTTWVHDYNTQAVRPYFPKARNSHRNNPAIAPAPTTRLQASHPPIQHRQQFILQASRLSIPDAMCKEQQSNRSVFSVSRLSSARVGVCEHVCDGCF
jgi:hypothetical protein